MQGRGQLGSGVVVRFRSRQRRGHRRTDPLASPAGSSHEQSTSAGRAGAGAGGGANQTAGKGLPPTALRVNQTTLEGGCLHFSAGVKPRAS